MGFKKQVLFFPAVTLILALGGCGDTPKIGTQSSPETSSGISGESSVSAETQAAALVDKSDLGGVRAVYIDSPRSFALIIDPENGTLSLVDTVPLGVSTFDFASGESGTANEDFLLFAGGVSGTFDGFEAPGSNSPSIIEGTLKVTREWSAPEYSWKDISAPFDYSVKAELKDGILALLLVRKGIGESSHELVRARDSENTIFTTPSHESFISAHNSSDAGDSERSLKLEWSVNYGDGSFKIERRIFEKGSGSSAPPSGFPDFGVSWERDLVQYYSAHIVDDPEGQSWTVSWSGYGASSGATFDGKAYPAKTFVSDRELGEMEKESLGTVFVPLSVGDFVIMRFGSRVPLTGIATDEGFDGFMLELSGRALEIEGIWFMVLRKE